MEITKWRPKSSEARNLNDIVVKIPIDRASEQIIDYAVSVARSFKAHLDGITSVSESLNTAPLTFEASAAAVAIAGTEYASGEELRPQ